MLQKINETSGSIRLALKRIRQSTIQFLRKISSSSPLSTNQKKSLSPNFVHIKVKFQKKDFKKLNIKKLQELLDLVSSN